MKKLGAASLFLLLTACLTGNAFAGIVFTVDGTGPDLVITSSGSLSLSGFSQTQAGSVWNSGLTYLRPRNVMTGSTSFDGYNSSATFFTEGGASTTQVFPSGPGYLAATTASGDYVAFQLGGALPLIYVPAGYTSNTPVSGSATYSGQTLASVGMTPSTVFKWYLGADGDDSQSITVVGVPEPAAYVIAFAGIAAGSVLYGRRKKSAGKKVSGTFSAPLATVSGSGCQPS